MRWIIVFVVVLSMTLPGECKEYAIDATRWIPAVESDPEWKAEEAKQSAAFSEFITSKDYRSEGVLEIQIPQSEEERRQYRKLRVWQIGVRGPSNEDLFDDSTLFPHLEIATLQCGKFNSVYVSELADHYPHLDGLTIWQKRPLDDTTLANISRFPRLDYLDLRCPVSNSAAVQQCVPPSVTYLQLQGAYPLSSLPHLRRLCVHDARIGQEFIDSLASLPKLRTMDLSYCVIEVGALKNINRIVALRELRFYRSPISDQDFDSLRPLRRLDICVPEERKRNGNDGKRYRDPGEYKNFHD